MNFEDSVALYAELALALAGFAGVVSAFAGRERQFRPVERLRLEGLMILSATVLAGCLAYIVGSVAGLAEASVLVITAIVCLISTGAVVLFMFPELWRRSKDADATVARWSLYLVSALILADLLLFEAAIFVPESAWMIALGFFFHCCYFMGYGCSYSCLRGRTSGSIGMQVLPNKIKRIGF